MREVTAALNCALSTNDRTEKAESVDGGPVSHSSAFPLVGERHVRSSEMIVLSLGVAVMDRQLATNTPKCRHEAEPRNEGLERT